MAQANFFGVALCLRAIRDVERAAKLHGAADALVETNDEAFEPVESERRSRNYLRVATHPR